MKKHIFYSFILLLLLTATMAKAQEYTNDTLWQASVGTKITDIMFSPNDQYLVVVGNNLEPTSYPIFFDAITGERLFEIKEADNSYFGSFNDDGSVFFCQGNNFKDLIVYDVINKKVTKRIPSEGYLWATGVYIKNKKQFWASYYTSIEPNQNDKLIMYNTETWEKINEIKGYSPDLIKSSPDGRYVGYRSDDDIVVMNTETYKFHKAFEMPERINDFAFSPDGTMIAGTSNEELIVWNFNSKDILLTLNEEGVFAYSSVCFSQDSKFLIEVEVKFNSEGFLDGVSDVISLENNKTVHTYPDGGGGGIDITNDNKYIAFANPIVYHAKWGETSVKGTPEEEVIYPNPTNGIVNIVIHDINNKNVIINIYDNNGIFIESIFNGYIKSRQNIQWNSSSYPSGTYYCKVESRSFNRSYKISVAK
jgi:hypothetical protein